jgi:hypothetical protein
MCATQPPIRCLPGLSLVLAARTSSSDDEPDASVPDSGTGELALRPDDAGVDYLLGGAYPPREGVGIVGRDRSASPHRARTRSASVPVA